MWEFEIICSRKNSTYISFIQEGLGQVLTQIGGVSAITADKNYVYLVLGCKASFAAKVKAKIKSLVADVMCERIKFDFIFDHMDAVSLGREYAYALAKICTYFDSSLDRQIVMESLELGKKKLNIESFFQFRLASLRSKWAELCAITTSNSRAIVKPENFVELVQFLLSNIETRSQSVILHLQDKCLIYHDQKNNFDIITAIDPQDKLLVLGKLIELNPLLIKIYASEDGAETIRLVKNIFTDKVITV